MKKNYEKPQIFSEKLLIDFLQTSSTCCPEMDSVDLQWSETDDPELIDICKPCTCLSQSPSF
jgi:hypothetical protein